MSEGFGEIFEKLYDSAKKVTRRERDVDEYYSEDSDFYSLDNKSGGSIKTDIFTDLRSDYHPDELFKETVEELSELVAEVCEYEEGYEESVPKKVEVERPWRLSNKMDKKEETVENPAEITIPGSELIEYMVQPIQKELFNSEDRDLDPGTLKAYGHLTREAIVTGINRAVEERGDESDSLVYNFQFDNRNEKTKGWLTREIGEAFERHLKGGLSDFTYDEESLLFADAFKSEETARLVDLD